MDDRLLAFIGVSIAVVVIPGPDMALIARNVLRHGRSAGFADVGRRLHGHPRLGGGGRARRLDPSRHVGDRVHGAQARRRGLPHLPRDHDVSR